MFFVLMWIGQDNLQLILIDKYLQQCTTTSNSNKQTSFCLQTEEDMQPELEPS